MNKIVIRSLKTNYEGILNILGMLIEYIQRIILLKTASKNFHSFKSWSDLFIIPFPLRVISLELCIDLGPQCNIL